MTTATDTVRNLISTTEYRGRTIRVWENQHRYPVSSWFYATLDREDFVQTSFNGDNAAKALRSAKHGIDVRIADEAIRERAQRFIGSLRLEEALQSIDGVHKATKDTPVGSVAWVFSRGRWYRGIAEKVGRTNVTVAYTTQSNPGFITRKSAPFDAVYVHP